MKKVYQNPILDVERIDHVDVITSSDPYLADINWDMSHLYQR